MQQTYFFHMQGAERMYIILKKRTLTPLSGIHFALGHETVLWFIWMSEWLHH